MESNTSGDVFPERLLQSKRWRPTGPPLGPLFDYMHTLKSHLNSAMVCTVVGTSNRRTSLVAAWTDQAKRLGIPFILRMAAGEGPTVDTEILLLAIANANGCVSICSDCVTAPGLSSGSPMPMYTALVRGGWKKVGNRATASIVGVCTVRRRIWC